MLLPSAGVVAGAVVFISVVGPAVGVEAGVAGLFVGTENRNIPNSY